MMIVHISRHHQFNNERSVSHMGTQKKTAPARADIHGQALPTTDRRLPFRLCPLLADHFI